MSSGVKVSPECVTVFEELKMHKQHRYILFKLSADKKSIVVDKAAARDSTHDDLTNELLTTHANECRYVAYDFDFKLEDAKGAADKNKIIFISWAPETAPVSPKMVHTTSKEYLKKALKLTIELQATDADEISLEAATERARRSMNA